MTKIVEKNKASKGLRIANYLIDLLVFYILIFTVFFIYGYISGDLIGVSDRLSEINPFLDRILTLLAYALYMFAIEALLKGKSIGKFLTGTKVVMINGSTPTTSNYFTRNISRAVPFDQLSFLGNNGWHDKWSETTVVNQKRFESELNLNQDISDIGKKDFY